MKYFVYILISEVTGLYYVGSTVNLTQRLRDHNTGRSKYTSRGKPWKLIWSKEFESRSDAMKEEERIKSRGAKRYLIDIGIGKVMKLSSADEEEIGKALKE